METDKLLTSAGMAEKYAASVSGKEAARRAAVLLSQDELAARAASERNEETKGDRP